MIERFLACVHSQYDSSEEIEPCKGPFNYLTFCFDEEAFSVVRPVRDLKNYFCLLNGLCKSATVSFVSHNFFKPVITVICILKQIHPFWAVMQICPMDMALIKASQYINQNLTLPPIDLFIAVNAAVLIDHRGSFTL